MKYLINFSKTNAGSSVYGYLYNLGVKNPMHDNAWQADLDEEQVMMLLLKFPDIEIYKPIDPNYKIYDGK